MTTVCNIMIISFVWDYLDLNQEPVGYEPIALPLSYSPVMFRAGNGIRTHARTLEGSCATTTPYPHTCLLMSGCPDSNRGPHAPKACALTGLRYTPLPSYYH